MLIRCVATLCHHAELFLYHRVYNVISVLLTFFKILTVDDVLTECKILCPPPQPTTTAGHLWTLPKRSSDRPEVPYVRSWQPLILDEDAQPRPGKYR